MLTALMAMLAAGPYVLAVGAFASIADNAVGVGALQAGSAGEDGQRRAARLDEAGFWAAAGAQNYLILVGAASTLLAALSLPVLVEAQGVDLTKPAVAMSGALGAAFVLAYMGNAIRCSARGARGVALEVERQLRGFPRDGGLAQVPRDYTPSYRACIDLTARSALEGTLRSLILALLPPAILGIGLSLMYRSTDPRLAVEGLASFVVVATATALAASLAVDSTRATLSVARRLSKPRGSSAGFAASVGSNALAGIMGNAAGPAAHFLVKATAITSIVLVPLLS
jgi:Na+/H+-translocating membrane pyrophosphatase